MWGSQMDKDAIRVEKKNKLIKIVITIFWLFVDGYQR